MDGSVEIDGGASARTGWWLLAGVVVGIGVVSTLVVVVASIASGGAPPEAMGPPVFADETATSGIDHTYDGEFSFFVGGGVAVFDCDADRRPDLYVAGGSDSAALYRNESPTGGALRFTRVASSATDMTDVTGAYPIDIDSDGETDLAVLRLGENVMLRGLGDCRFERANEDWGIDGGDDWTAAFSAQWESAASLPTLAFGNYAVLDPTGTKATGCDDHSMVRPEGSSYGDPIVLSPGYCTLSILFSDWNGSGYRDLRMANDRHYYVDGEEQLWQVRPGEIPRPYSEEDGWQRMQIWGMGIASYDVTGDGLSEVLLTSQGDNKLQTLAAGVAEPDYEDIAFAVGVTAHRPYEGDTSLPSTAWHPEFDDVNNDGYIDLFLTKGNVDSQSGYAAEDPNNLLLGSDLGTFREVAPEAGVDDTERSRGAALADLNLDGLLDLVVVDRRQPVRVWRNVGSGDASNPSPMGHWIGVDIQQEGPNRDAIGSWIEVRTSDGVQRREVTIGGGHAGGQLGWTHFGLGPDTDAQIRVIWPDGHTGRWLDVDADGFFIISREHDEPTRWDPKQA